jgi:hypothetical protein
MVDTIDTPMSRQTSLKTHFLCTAARRYIRPRCYGWICAATFTLRCIKNTETGWRNAQQRPRRRRKYVGDTDMSSGNQFAMPAHRVTGIMSR